MNLEGSVRSVRCGSPVLKVGQTTQSFKTKAIMQTPRSKCRASGFIQS